MGSSYCVRLPRRQGTYGSVTGHVVCFPDNAADICASVMPNAEFAGKEVCISIEGPAAAMFVEAATFSITNG